MKIMNSGEKMLKQVIVLIFAGLLCNFEDCLAAPACYENAETPAHEFIFRDPSSLKEVTALSPDGKSCVRVGFWNGKPLIRQKLYMPFGKLYEAYARAIENRDIQGAKKLFAYGRPTPRNLGQFLPLYTTPPGNPMPWGKPMFEKIFNILQPFPSFGRDILRNYNPGSEGLNWSAMFFFMGGELYPDGQWVPGKKYPVSLDYFIPLASIERNKKEKKMRFNQ